MNPCDGKIFDWRRIAIGTFATAGLMMSGCLAGDWEIIPRVALEERYTDNLTQTQTGQLSDFVTEMTPGLSVRGEGGRVELTLDYNFQRLLYADNGQFDQTNHQFDADGLAELYEDIIFVEVNSTVSQQSISNTLAFAENTSTPTGNRDDVIFYYLRPYFQHRLGNWADIETGFSFSSSASDSQAFGNRDETATDIEINSGPRLGFLILGLNWQSSEQTFGNDTENNLRRIDTTIGYVVNSKFTFDTSAGYERNDFSDGEQRTNINWSVGGTWIPSPRTSVSGSYASRPFGKTINFDASYRIRRFTLELSHLEDLRTSNQLQQNLQLVEQFNVFGQQFFDSFTSSSIGTPLNTASINSGVAVDRSTRLSAGFAGRRTDLTVRYFRNDREFNDTTPTELINTIDTVVNYRLSRRLQARLGFLWRRGEGGNNVDRRIRVDPEIRYDLGPNTDLRVRYEYSSGNGGRNENSVALGLTYDF
ncbi:MAG: TIGR03016 family PEP-CTERM system-associated outer membrane protein [Pseudomonadota bacterium]